MAPPPSELGVTNYETNIETYNVVVMSQSCDLLQKKVELVLVCPYWSLEDFAEKQEILKSGRGKNALRRGEIIGHHLLNKCEIPQYETGYLVVDFRVVFSVPIEIILKLARSNGKRIRLLPPYRENLSQAFARFIMRVGLPDDIPPFPQGNIALDEAA
jgi:hypothetical protein